eukprot:scaffold14410_cov60-Phaeocystis_antarctica.AAC.2
MHLLSALSPCTMFADRCLTCTLPCPVRTLSCPFSPVPSFVLPPNLMFALAIATRSAVVATRSAVIASRSASVAARGGAATMADEAALWGDPATLCTLEELHAARVAHPAAALASPNPNPDPSPHPHQVLRTPLLPSWPTNPHPHPHQVLRTPLLPSWPVGGARLSLKLESLQTTGSFKIRGTRRTPDPKPKPNSLTLTLTLTTDTRHALHA